MQFGTDDFFEGMVNIKKPWRDTMQVCLSGHLINSSYQRYPEDNKEFCDKCGAKTIIECPSCNQRIPGALQSPDLYDSVTSVPPFCVNCGSRFPWSNEKSSNKVKQDDLVPIETLQKIFGNFHSIVRQLRKRHDNRNTLDVNDEYDVQDLLRTILYLFFDDIRLEEWTPSYAGKSSRMDFLLKKEEIVVETKMTRKGLTGKEIGDELIIDISRYKSHKNCKTLICFIYDPDGRVNNAKGLIADLQTQSVDNFKVYVFVNPI